MNSLNVAIMYILLCFLFQKRALEEHPENLLLSPSVTGLYEKAGGLKRADGGGGHRTGRPQDQKDGAVHSEAAKWNEGCS